MSTPIIKPNFSGNKCEIGCFALSLSVTFGKVYFNNLPVDTYTGSGNAPNTTSGYTPAKSTLVELLSNAKLNDNDNRSFELPPTTTISVNVPDPSTIVPHG